MIVFQGLATFGQPVQGQFLNIGLLLTDGRAKPGQQIGDAFFGPVDFLTQVYGPVALVEIEYSNRSASCPLMLTACG